MLTENQFYVMKLLTAKSSATSPSILAKLAKENSSLVRITVALNPNTPTLSLLNLYETIVAKEVRETICYNLTTKPEYQHLFKNLKFLSLSNKEEAMKIKLNLVRKELSKQSINRSLA